MRANTGLPHIATNAFHVCYCRQTAAQDTQTSQPMLFTLARVHLPQTLGGRCASSPATGLGAASSSRGSGCGPTASFVSDQLADLIFSALPVECKERLLRHRSFTYASDCSGADVPFGCASSIAQLISRRADVPTECDYMFASEAPGSVGNAARTFLALNGPPRVLFTDATKRIPSRDRDCLTGICAYRGQFVLNSRCNLM